MHIKSLQNNTKNISIIILILAFTTFAYTKEPKSASSEENLGEFQKMARMYRAQGVELQQQGDLDSARKCYQKAVELDPSYAIAYNDLGIIYEANGLNDKAEESYLKCIELDPAYLSAYSNLAILYENKRDLEQSAFYWKRRAELGSPGDPWTEKARQRLEDMRLVLSDRPLSDMREQEVAGFLTEMEIKKSKLRKDNKELSKDYFEKAKLKFNKGDEVNAFKMALDANQLDPANTEIVDFIEKIQTRQLSK
jgi:tetratricopeptide (TPR) repeat protein